MLNASYYIYKLLIGIFNFTDNRHYTTSAVYKRCNKICTYVKNINWYYFLSPNLLFNLTILT